MHLKVRIKMTYKRVQKDFDNDIHSKLKKGIHPQ